MMHFLIRMRAVLAMTAVCVLGACAQGGQSTSQGAGAAPEVQSDPPQYATSAEQFAGLQRAGLSADYRAFAGHLKADDPAAVTAELQSSFQGRPFDVYTKTAEPGAEAHKRLVELRSTTGRLYLFVELDKVPGGWRVAEYKLDRKQAAVRANL